MKKLFLLVVGLSTTSTLFPCMTPLMSLDDSVVKNASSQNRNNNQGSQSEPSSPIDPAILMPHSSQALRLYAYLQAKKQAANGQNSQHNSSSAA